MAAAHAKGCGAIRTSLPTVCAARTHLADRAHGGSWTGERHGTGKATGGELSFECIWMRDGEPAPLDRDLVAAAAEVAPAAVSVGPSADVEVVADDGKGPKGGRRKSTHS